MQPQDLPTGLGEEEDSVKWKEQIRILNAEKAAIKEKLNHETANRAEAEKLLTEEKDKNARLQEKMEQKAEEQ